MRRTAQWVTRGHSPPYTQLRDEDPEGAPPAPQPLNVRRQEPVPEAPAPDTESHPYPFRLAHEEQDWKVQLVSMVTDCNKGGLWFINILEGSSPSERSVRLAPSMLQNGTFYYHGPLNLDGNLSVPGQKIYKADLGDFTFADGYKWEECAEGTANDTFVNSERWVLAVLDTAVKRGLLTVAKKKDSLRCIAKALL